MYLQNAKWGNKHQEVDFTDFLSWKSSDAFRLCSNFYICCSVGTLTSNEEWLGLNILTNPQLGGLVTKVTNCTSPVPPSLYPTRKWGGCLISTCICTISCCQVSKTNQPLERAHFSHSLVFAVTSQTTCEWGRREGGKGARTGSSVGVGRNTWNSDNKLQRKRKRQRGRKKGN